YLKTFAFPVSLTHNQLWVISQISFQSFYFPLIVVCMFFTFISLAGLYVRKKSNKLFKSYIFLTLWFLIGLAIHLNIFPLDQTVADRWLYLPLVGLLGMIGVGLELIIINKKKFINTAYIILI